MKNFSVVKLPRIEFGRGKFGSLPDFIASYGQRVLLVTGGKSFRGQDDQGPHWSWLLQQLETRKIHWRDVSISSEPSPLLIDETVKQFSREDFDVVVGIGGGSPLDAAKAIAGLLKVRRSVMDYLEGVGPELDYEGPAVPLIAVPTTAGTGSEATKNAVLSMHRRTNNQNTGFKKSFRHEKLIAEIALVDPALSSTCPPDLIAANGMDAMTQLIESYVSVKANAFTDSLAWHALELVAPALLRWYKQGEAAHDAQDDMAYAAMVSGITLAQVGLGSVHGLASPLGAFYPIPHGVVCGTLLAAATATNIKALQTREPGNVALVKYAQLGELLMGQSGKGSKETCKQLVTCLAQWCEDLNLPRLSAYNIAENDLDHIVAHSRGSSMQTNPIVLTDSEIKAILRQRL